MRPFLCLVFAIIVIIHQVDCSSFGDSDEAAEWNVFGSNHQLPTFQLRPFQHIRSIIQEIGNDDDDDEQQSDDVRAKAKDNLLPPWRHHIDFDEQHPGEDLIAVETSRYENPVAVEQVESEESNKRVGGQQKTFRGFDVGDTSLPFPLFDSMRINHRPESISSMWSRIFGQENTIFRRPWWQGSNVCMKREEEDGAIPESGMDQSETEIISEFPESIGTLSETSDDELFQLPTFTMTSCEDKDDMHSCMTHLMGPNVNKTIRTDYECCHGYLLNAQKQACERGALKSIAKTLTDIGAKEFSRLMTNVGLDAKLENENLTLFVPTDDAIASFMQSNQDFDSNNEITIAFDREELMRRRRSVLLHQTQTPYPQMDLYTSEQIHPVNNLQRSPLGQQLPEETNNNDWRSNALNQQDAFRRSNGHRSRSRNNYDEISYSHTENNQNLQQLLLNHMIQGKLSTNDFVDEKILFSENKDNSVLRLNTWNVHGEKVHTINCARLVSVNHRCSNGIVHLVNGMIKPVTKTIADIITSEPELTTLKALVSLSGLLPSLRDTQEHFTFFAPTNAAMNKLGPVILAKLRNGDTCLKRIMRNHILPITLCTSIVTQSGEVRNLNHELMSMERTSDDKLFINGSQIITRDIVTTNGIVHIIDAVLTTERDAPIASALARGGFTAFLDKLSQAGLKNMLDDLTNVTIFAPTNTAMESLPAEVLSNTTRLRDILLYHIAVPETRACHFTNEQNLKTMFNTLSIRINLNSMLFATSMPLQGSEGEVTAQCGILKHVNRPACNGIIHTIDRVLIPSDMNLIQTLQTQSDFTIFSRLLQESDLAESVKGVLPLTIFAPTDAAFYKLPREQLTKILNDKDESLKLLKLYIVRETICCAGISPQLWFLTKRVSTLNGLSVPIFRDFKGQIMFGQSKVSVCDLTASNGVIHSIDTLIDVKTLRTPNEYMLSCLTNDSPF